MCIARSHFPIFEIDIWKALIVSEMWNISEHDHESLIHDIMLCAHWHYMSEMQSISDHDHESPIHDMRYAHINKQKVYKH